MHELDIPSFLRISQADRKEAWLTFKPRIVKEEVKKFLPLNPPKQDDQGVKPKVDKPKSTHGNVGKAWMLNRVTGERARVDVSQVAVYEAKGFIKGGPRSK